MGQEKELSIGISSYEPFVIGDDKSAQGFSIDLWEKIARANGWNYRFVFSDFRTKLANVKNNKVDLAIGGITITAERERVMDFSSPTFNAGLGILVRKNVTTQAIVPLIISKLFTWEIASLLLWLFGSLLFVGFLLWTAERGSNLIRRNFKDGYPDAIWCAWMIKTTIGFGDIYPKQITGRLITIPIFLFGVVLLSVIIAPINAAFIVRDIEVLESKIASPLDLRDKAVATKAGTFSVDVLRKYDAFIISVPTIREAYDLLRKKEVDAVVYDLPGLLYYAKNNSDVALVGKDFANNHYGFAFP
ncbi:MAG: transporter substrate-binding domain-containing protein, partial [Desulfobacteraceae bacterium]|nr:transporter substrate-binding domain-containing protein [Desulfobacteraceae bacterium]